jgi:hypothetical protein
VVKEKNMSTFTQAKDFLQTTAGWFSRLSPKGKTLAVAGGVVALGVIAFGICLDPGLFIQTMVLGAVLGTLEHGAQKLVEWHDKRKEKKQDFQAPETSGPTLDSKCPSLGPQFAQAQSGTALNSSITVRAPLVLKR